MIKGFPLFRAIQKKIDRINLVLREGLTGIRVIRAFNRVEDEKKRFDDANLDLMTVSIQLGRTFAILVPILMFVMNFTTIMVIWFGAVRVDRGTSNVGNMMAFLQYAMQILFSLLMASFVFIMLPRAQASAIRINEVLDTVPEITDPETAAQAGGEEEGLRRVQKRELQLPRRGGARAQRHQLLGQPGEVTAIIGSTGSGKSTLINLIPRFYDVDAGSILIDGVDVRDMSQKDLRSRIGLVPQKAVLFSGSVAENIATATRARATTEVTEAAETAQAIEFISEMKEGFDSVIAQGGTNVSGGQKQRLSIARALVRKPEIYLFDDSFSALDFKTDARLRAALRAKTADATVLIVGQRVATIMDADRIIVLDEGQDRRHGHPPRALRELRGLQGDRRVPALRGGDSMSDSAGQRRAPPPGRRAAGRRTRPGSWTDGRAWPGREAQGREEDHQLPYDLLQAAMGKLTLVFVFAVLEHDLHDRRPQAHGPRDHQALRRAQVQVHGGIHTQAHALDRFQLHRGDSPPDRRLLPAQRPVQLHPAVHDGRRLPGHRLST